MGSTLLLCLAAVAGIDTGWQPLDGGGVEYLVQVTPDAVEQFQQNGYAANIPPEAQDVRRFVIFMGSGKLPRTGGAQRTAPISTAESFDIRILDEHVQHLRDGLVTTVDHKRGVNRFTIHIGDEPAPKPEPPAQGNPFSKGTGSPATVDDPAVKGIGRGVGSNGPGTESESSPFPPLSPPRADGTGFDARRPPSGTDTTPLWMSRPPAGQFPVDSSAATGPIGSGDEKTATIPSVTKKPEIDPSPAVSAVSPSDEVKPGAKEENGAVKPADEPNKPWAPLIVALLTLFGSLGANIYLSWLNWDSRARYKALLTEIHGQTPAA